MQRMSDRSKFLLTAFAGVTVAAVFLGGCARTITSHPVTTADMGRAASSGEMVASLDLPGVVTFEKIVAVDWVIPRGNFIDLDDPASKAAGIEGGEEPGHIYFHAIRHPRFGLFLIDAGVSKALRENASFFVRKFFLDKVPFTLRQTTGAWLAARSNPGLAGVFLTHPHFDHVAGLLDVAKQTPVFVGKGEAADAQWTYLLFGDTIDNFLKGFGPLREWDFAPDPDGQFDDIIDIFGDGSVWAIHVPGHTPGSTAYLIRSTDGPKLIIGDAAHTRLGWNLNLPQAGGKAVSEPARVSVDRLHRLTDKYPAIEVHLGHQDLGRPLTRDHPDH